MIALLTLRNNYFCKRLTADGKDHCLESCILTITQEAQLLVEEPVMERHIQGIKYDLDNQRMLEETVMVMGEHTHKNSTPHSQFYDVKIFLKNTATSTWKANFSLKLGLKATFDVQLPLLVDGKTEVSGEVHEGCEFGKTYTHDSNMEYTHKVEVSPKSKMPVNLVSTLGKYDIPFTYMQKDTLYNGKLSYMMCKVALTPVLISTTPDSKSKKCRSALEFQSNYTMFATTRASQNLIR